jgi:hypothetical protein
MVSLRLTSLLQPLTVLPVWCITFTINAPTADASWHGSATRPQTNMLVTVNSVIYPILSAVANGSGWDVTISRPNPTNRSDNLGLNGAVSNPAAVRSSFVPRSLLAVTRWSTSVLVLTTVHCLRMVVCRMTPIRSLNLTTVRFGLLSTDHNGKFKVGDFFEVDQQLGYVTIPEGSIAFDLVVGCW